MVSTALILLTKHFVTLLYITPVAVIMCREIAVSALREWMAERGQRSAVKVGQMGKWKTAFQMISTSLLLIVFPGQSKDFDLCNVLHLSKAVVFTLGIATLYFSTALTMLSGWEYFTAARPLLFGNAAVPEQGKGPSIVSGLDDSIADEDESGMINSE